MIFSVRFDDGERFAQKLALATTAFVTAAGRWEAGDRPHVWMFDVLSVLRFLEASPVAVDSWLTADLLSDEDVSLAESMHPARRAEFVATRLVLRSVVGAYAAASLETRHPSFHFYRRPGGKPLARSVDGALSFRCFNASHSNGILVAAIAPEYGSGFEVGVDVEAAAPPRGLERTRGSGLSGDALREWVMREAMLKSVGVGLSPSSDAPDVAGRVERTLVADLGPEWRGQLGQGRDGACSGWPDLELAVAWSEGDLCTTT